MTPRLALQHIGAAGLACMFAAGAHAGVLPDERADVMWKTYQGGGITVQGPSILVRKNFADTVSVSAGYLVDQVTGASIDMIVVHASPLREERKQKSLSVDYLYGKTTYTAGVQNGVENDYDSSTANVAIKQDMFGDMTSVTLGVSRGWDIVTRIDSATHRRDPNFRQRVDRKSWSLSLSQVLSRSLNGGFDYEAITEQGYLQNPYRDYRFLVTLNPASYNTTGEIYPGTRTSNAFTGRLKYYLPWHGALTSKYRYFQDTWGIRAHTAEVTYSQALLKETLIGDVNYRAYRQNSASFYSDLFQAQTQQNFMGRDRELESQTNTSVGVALSYDFLRSRRWHIKKAAVSLHFDYIMYRYNNFRDATLGLPLGTLPAGTEPLYRFNATVVQALYSFWF